MTDLEVEARNDGDYLFAAIVSGVLGVSFVVVALRCRLDWTGIAILLPLSLVCIVFGVRYGRLYRSARKRSHRDRIA